ncbi:hypothetical protein D0869_10468 [Hortaea werneckii]|uniref:Uncharacterized protein n=1 Tax=Hortaea werneckii TaxID=91943 RepID=A0A3M6WDX4_HORWE|nr:hypothetical protein D0869_10468 [Hortaea werneckii]RMY02610.1 hypothetical protein D0868_07892 [Hortaea werneckii]
MYGSNHKVQPPSHYNSTTMSAPQQGRQSPDPERQGKSQIHEPPATNVNQQGQAPAGSEEAAGTKNQTQGLASNPKEHVLDKAAEDKTK